MAKIIGPGSLNVDVTGYTPHLPVDGETVKGSTLKFGPGGKGNNQMTAASRAGCDVKIIACRGNDVLGQIIKEHYQTEGMSEELIDARDEFETGSAIIEIDEVSAQNRIIVISGANEKVDRQKVYESEKFFADCDAVLTQFETTIDAVYAAKELANKYNKPFILNPAPFIKVENDLFNGVDYVTPNETETQQFTGVEINNLDDCKIAAKKFFDMGVKNVIITLGKRGAFFTDGKNEVLVPSLNVKAKDTTGAGDAFNGGLATAIAEGHPIDVALKFATCTAALSVTKLGSAKAMPIRSEIIALMKKEFNVEI